MKAFNNVDKVILVNVKKNKNIVYGARAIQKNVGILHSRPTKDWDILSTKPKKSSLQIERKLDRMSGGNYFFTTPSKYHKGTYKLKEVGLDNIPNTKDDIGIADFTKLKKLPKYNTFRGIRYVKLEETAKDKKTALKDKNYKFRHEKDREDLEYINRYKHWKKDVVLKNFLIK